MTQHIGILAGSAEGIALCYRTICLEAPDIMGEHAFAQKVLALSPRSRTTENSPAIHRWDWQSLEGKSVKRTAEKALI